MTLDPCAARIRADIIRLAHSALDSVNLRRQVAAKLDRIVAMDAYGFAIVDPTTLMFTGAVRRNIRDPMSGADPMSAGRRQASTE
jgi:hypothetical protein